MKFIASTTTLLKALQVIAGTITPGKVLPILEDFLFELRAGKLTVFATDLELSMITEIMVEAKDTGRIAVPAKLLIETLKTLPEQPLVFKVDEKTFAVEITSETGHYRLPGDNPDDFPKIPGPDKVTEFHIAPAVLGNAIDKTLFAVSKDDLRPAMTGVLFRISPEGMTFVATDAHQLVKMERSDITVAGTKTTEFIVPRKGLSLMKAGLQGTEAAVKVEYSKTNAFFTAGATKLICRLIDANYPDFNAVIPKEAHSTIQINRLELLNAMRRIQLYSNNTTYQTIFTISGSELKLSTEDIDTNKGAAEKLTISYEGEDIEIGFNAKFLIEVLSTLDNADIDIDVSAPTRAAIFRPTDNEENEVLLMLVMPVMINE